MYIAWNSSWSSMPNTGCIHDAFNLQAARTPDAVAVFDGERSLTYAELQRLSSRLADKLRGRGVRPDVAVALAVDRSLEAIVGILGILNAGGAYVPIGLRDPTERMACIVRDAAVSVVVAQPNLRDRLNSCGIDTVVLNVRDFEMPSPVINFESGTNAEHLATIVYTSGTAGKPKGVEIPHRAIMARLQSGYAPQRGDLQKASLTTVAHFSDLLLPLLSGGPVIIVGDGEVRSGLGLLQRARISGTSRLVLVPSQLAAILDGIPDGDMDAFREIRTVILSGEPLAKDLVVRFKLLAPHAELINGYGTSEVAGLTCMGAIQSPDDITVGTPLEGCEVYVLDEKLREVPIGLVGEVYLGGPQLARGYRQEPALTAERFVPHPFRVGGRLYRTGDLAEWREHGRLRVLGRRDFEVKVHGFRVNLSEIEACLEGFADVNRAVVVLDGYDMNQTLNAYVVAKPGVAAQPDELRRLVGRMLPSYMAPSRFHFVEDLPVLSTGKVDRLTLQQHARASHCILPITAPLEGTEHLISKLWSELFGIRHIGVEDDFFALGGDSIQAMRFVTRAGAVGLKVTLAELAAAPTLKALAGAIDAKTKLDRERVPVADRA
jgi:amino acid adenylation domain-containing protein